MRRLLLAIAAALAVAGCSRKVIYSHYEHVPTDGWGRTDTLHFCVVGTQADSLYSELLGLRVSSAYPFTALTMIVQQRVKGTGVQCSDTVSIQLTDEEGNRMGEGISLYLQTASLPSVKLVKGDTLCVDIRHYMEREWLTGIADIGLTLRSESGQ